MDMSKIALVAATATTLTLASFLAASADPTPYPAPTPTPIVVAPGVSVPGNLQNSPIVQSVLRALGGITQTTNGNTAHGRVTYFKRFSLQLQTAPGVYRQINLHQGTIIDPRGTSLTEGMTVEVAGNPQNDGSLNADSITVR